MVRPRHGWLPGAFVMLTLALKEGLALGVAYGIWSAGEWPSRQSPQGSSSVNH